MSAETKDRMARRQNLIVAGLNLRVKTNDEVKWCLEEFFRNEVEVHTRVLEATLLAPQVYLAKVASFHDKIAIFRNIYKLVKKGIKVDLYPDLTRKEKQIQDKIVARAVLEQAKGNRVKMGYQKLIINKQLHVWNEETGEIELKHQHEQKKLGDLYEILDKVERKKRLKNIIIKGLATNHNGGPELAREIEQFLASAVGIYTRVLRAEKPRLYTIIARMDTVRDKMRVLNMKRQIYAKGIPVHIGADLTKTEINIQAEIERIAAEARRKGNHVTTGYKKMFVNGVKHTWNRTLNSLVQSEVVDPYEDGKRRWQLKEDRERNRRRHNVIVSGLVIPSDNETTIKAVTQQFFASELGVQTHVRKVMRVKPDLHIVQVANEIDKSRILRNKYSLFQRGISVLLYPDRTRHEMRVQFEISKYAKDEIEKGSNVKFGYRSLIVNRQKWVWNDEQEKLVQMTAFDTQHLKSIQNVNEELKRDAQEFKRNNRVIIIGLNFKTSNKTRIMAVMERFFQSRLYVNVTVVKVNQFRNDVYVVELASAQQKTDLMENTYLLKDDPNMFVYIEADRTPVEKMIQNQLVMLGKDEMKKGNYVRTGYLRLFINSDQWAWDDKSHCLVLLPGTPLGYD